MVVSTMKIGSRETQLSHSMKSRNYLVLALLVIGIASLTWHETRNRHFQSRNPENIPATVKSSENATESRSPASERKMSATESNSKTTREISDESVEMRNLAGVPVSVGIEGLWAGQMADDAAVPGKASYAVATLGGSKADLKPDQNGMFQRLHAPTDSPIDFLIRYTDLEENSVVHVGLLDGGSLDRQGPFEPDSLGRVSFRVSTGASDGSYRLLLTTSDHDVKMIDVWAGRPEWEQPITSK
jgi:hypothetical protein